MDLPKLAFTVLDTETTGLTPRVNKIVEFASVRVEKGKITDEYEQLFTIAEELPSLVQVLTRIQPEHLQGKPSFADTQAEIENHIGANTLIVGQNVGFDIAMLKGEGIDLSERPWIDTSMLASLVFPELASYSLSFVSTALNLHHEPIHRALGDVRATLSLFEKCWQRLLELPADMREEAVHILLRSSPGYKLLFAELPFTDAPKTKPQWLTALAVPGKETDVSPVQLPLPEAGTVHLVEDSLSPQSLPSIIAGAAQEKNITHWIAVKNLQAILRRMQPPEAVRVLHPPFQMLDPNAADHLQAQSTFTAAEATLAVKLKWYGSNIYANLPLHGDEKSVWNGKLACTEQSPSYVEQFKNLPNVVLLDQRQLLFFLADETHPAYKALKQNSHIIVDDASMLEDTATKAYGHYCATDDLRAAAEGNTPLTKLVDALQLWVEKTRNFQDVAFLDAKVLEADEAKGLRMRVQEVLLGSSLLPNAKRMLEAVAAILDPAKTKEHIVWIEIKRDGGQMLQSVPCNIGDFLKNRLYSCAVTLLIPKFSENSLQTILPPSVPVKLQEYVELPDVCIPISFQTDASLQSLFENPPEGKSVVLLGSKRSIEDQFVRHTVPLEQKDVALFCQGTSGGQERMQEEFMAAPRAMLVVTPWMYEGMEFPPGSIDHLFLFSLPFDHPAHPVVSKRAEKCRNGFTDYTMPRLMHRLFRILRTFGRHRTEEGDAQILDERIDKKEYGKVIKRYLKDCAGEDSSPSKKEADQLSMF